MKKHKAIFSRRVQKPGTKHVAMGLLLVCHSSYLLHSIDAGSTASAKDSGAVQMTYPP